MFNYIYIYINIVEHLLIIDINIYKSILYIYIYIYINVNGVSRKGGISHYKYFNLKTIFYQVNYNYITNLQF